MRTGLVPFSNEKNNQDENDDDARHNPDDLHLPFAVSAPQPAHAVFWLDFGRRRKRAFVELCLRRLTPFLKLIRMSFLVAPEPQKHAQIKDLLGIAQAARGGQLRLLPE